MLQWQCKRVETNENEGEQNLSVNNYQGNGWITLPLK